MDTKEIRIKAVRETLQFFSKDQFKLIFETKAKFPTVTYLENYLEKDNLTEWLNVKQMQLKHNPEYVINEAKDKLIEITQGIEFYNDAFIFNSRSVINKVINDYCTLIYYYYLYDALIDSFSKPKPKEKIKTSYIWQNNADKELPELYRLMKDTYKLIDPQTNLEQFTAVFTGQNIENINPIKWISAKNLNAYLIDQLICKRKLSKNVNKDIWEISKSCFSNGSNFSQLIDNYKNNKSGKPKNHKLIDDLLNTLDTLP